MQPISRSRATRLAAVLGAVVVIVVGACTGSGPSAAPVADTPEPTAATATTQPLTPSEPPADAWLAVGRKGVPGLEVILAGTNEHMYDLPLSVPDALWGHLVTTVQAPGETIVKEITVQPDLPGQSRSVPGRWRLPTIGRDTIPVGVSGQGDTVVLVEDGAPTDAATTRFAILVRGASPQILELAGSLEFDALSPDGSILYVVEHLPGPPDAHYQVRAVDIATGRMRDDVIVDKRNLDESMGGWPITQARHQNGVAFTLYRGAEHPFIHALNTAEAWAICLDLPEAGADDAAAAADWGLAVSPDGATVYAVNATLGLATAIDAGELSIRRNAAFESPRAAATITLAKFGHQESGPVGRRVIVSPDGSTLYAAGAGGIVRLEANSLNATGMLLEGAPVDGLAMTPDGTTMYALLAGRGQIVKIDASSGTLLGEVAGDGFDRLVAIVPW
jgi:hypothetical protein